MSYKRSGILFTGKTSIENFLKGKTGTNTSTGEESLRDFFEQLFGSPFPKAMPATLVNPLTGRTLELDGYNEQLKIAFEHNGWSHDKIAIVIEKDKIKSKWCSDNGVRLITVPDLTNHFRMSERKLKQYLIDAFKKASIEVPKTIFTAELRTRLGKSVSSYHVYKEALDAVSKVQTRSEFQRRFGRLYRWLVKHNLVEAVLKPIASLRTPVERRGIKHKIWSDEELIEMAAGFKTISSFQSAHPAAAVAMRRRGLHKQCFVRNTKFAKRYDFNSFIPEETVLEMVREEKTKQYIFEQFRSAGCMASRRTIGNYIDRTVKKETKSK